MLGLPTASLVLFGVAAVGLVIVSLQALAVYLVRRQRLPSAKHHPSVSFIKPLCGLDDELVENLMSHLDVDYPGDWEVILGVRSEEDLAYPIARDFAAAHPERVRLVIQEGEPGHNPKVNQLITLTRHARYEVIASTDSNVRVGRNHLREVASLLEQPGVGLATHMFAGVGEKRLGAILDNLTLASFCAPNVAAVSKYIGVDEVVGKALALRRTLLEDIGGWHAVKDVLAEDQQLGLALRQKGLRCKLCPTPVLNVQRNQQLKAFWMRHTRWAMIRYRVIFPIVLLEPVLSPAVLALVAALLAPTHGAAWALAGGASLAMIALTQTCAKLVRGQGFRLHHLLWVPLRDLLLVAAWMRGATMRRVNWRGNRLLVLARTRLAAREALARARNMQRSGR